MAQINWMRVVLGGFLAGLAIDAFEFMLTTCSCRSSGPMPCARSGDRSTLVLVQ
jgi:hypothetical protein